MKTYRNLDGRLIGYARHILKCGYQRLAKRLGMTKIYALRAERGEAKLKTHHYNQLSLFTGNSLEELGYAAVSNEPYLGPRGKNWMGKAPELHNLSLDELQYVAVELREELREAETEKQKVSTELRLLKTKHQIWKGAKRAYTSWMAQLSGTIAELKEKDAAEARIQRHEEALEKLEAEYLVAKAQNYMLPSKFVLQQRTLEKLNHQQAEATEYLAQVNERIEMLKARKKKVQERLTADKQPKADSIRPAAGTKQPEVDSLRPEAANEQPTAEKANAQPEAAPQEPTVNNAQDSNEPPEQPEAENNPTGKAA